jgi:hypothetical protein
MTVTSRARARIKKAAEEAVAAQKGTYADRIRRIQRIVSPALTNAELSTGLELEAPAEGRPGASDIGRYLSTKARYARTRPDADLRAMIDQILAGDVLLAVQSSGGPGARRALLVCEAHEAVRLDRDWSLINVAGRAAPLRDFELKEDSVWSMLGAEGPPPHRPPPLPTRRPWPGSWHHGRREAPPAPCWGSPPDRSRWAPCASPPPAARRRDRKSVV